MLSRRLLAATALTGAALVLAPNGAFANCDVGPAANVVACTGTYATVDVTFPTSANSSNNGRNQQAVGVNGSIVATSSATITGFGLAVSAQGTGNASLDNSGSVAISSSPTKGGSAGVGVIAVNGAATYTGNGSITSTVTNGLELSHAGGAATGNLSATVDGNVTSGSNIGLLVSTGGTGKVIVAGSGTISGSTGISATQSNATAATDGDITIGGTGNVSMTGSSGTGISINHGANAGTVLINRSGTIDNGAGGAGDGSGIEVNDNGSGGIQITGVGAINVTSQGIGAVANGNGNIQVTPGGAITANFSGIFAGTNGAGNVTITSAFNISSSGGDAISTDSVDGNTQVNVTAGTILAGGGGSAINTSTTGSGGIIVNMTGGQLGTSASRISGYGIAAATNAANAGNISMTSGTIFGSDVAVRANQLGTNATVSVTANGAIDTTGTTAINTSAQAGSTTINLNSSLVSSSNTEGVIQASSNGGGFTINNNSGGSISSTLSTPESRRAITVNNFANGDVALTNSASLTGTVFFAAGNNTIANSGTWTVGGTNALGIGSTAISNSGSINVVGTAAMTGTAVTLTNSTGTLNLTTPASILNLTGTLAFQGGGTYRINLDPTTSSVTNVTGTASLGGSVNAVFAAGSYATKQYTILTTTGGRTGTFSGLTTTSAPAGFTSLLSYDANNAYLDLAAIAGGTAGPSGLPGNQQAAANSIANYFNNGGTLPPGFVTLQGSSNPSNAFGQVAGQPGAAQTQAGNAQTTQFINSIFDTLIDSGGNGGATNFADDALAYAGSKKRSREAQDAYAAVTPRDRMSPVGSRWGVWASGYGGNQRVDGNAAAGTNTTTSHIYGVTVGADYRYSDNTRIGLAMGGAGSSFSLDQAFGGGSADMFNAAVYAKHNFGAAYVAGALIYSWQDAKTDRTVTVAGTDRLHASFNASALAGRIEGGYRYALPAITLIPYAAIQSTTFFLPAYGEVATSGSNQFALNYTSHDVTATRAELGARFDKVMLVQGGTFAWKGKLAWAHDWNNDRRATATFQALVGSSSFTVNGAQPSANAALVSLGGEMAWHNGWSIAANLDGEFSSTTLGFAGKATLRRVW